MFDNPVTTKHDAVQRYLLSIFVRQDFFLDLTSLLLSKTLL